MSALSLARAIAFRTALSTALLTVPAFAVAIGSGTTTGSFINPTPGTCIPSSGIVIDVYVPVCDGVGSSLVSWGNPGSFGVGQSWASFTTAPFTNVAQGEIFVLGTLTYYNGTVFTGTEITDIVLRIQTTSSTPELNQLLLLPFHILQTPNGNIDPIADADFLYFSNAVQFGSFRVLEGSLATVQLLGRFGSLNNEGFGSVTGPGFLLSSIDPVPEPSTWTLGCVGLALVAVRWRRKP